MPPFSFSIADSASVLIIIIVSIVFEDLIPVALVLHEETPNDKDCAEDKSYDHVDKDTCVGFDWIGADLFSNSSVVVALKVQFHDVLKAVLKVRNLTLHVFKSNFIIKF